MTEARYYADIVEQKVVMNVEEANKLRREGWEYLKIPEVDIRTEFERAPLQRIVVWIMGLPKSATTGKPVKAEPVAPVKEAKAPSPPPSVAEGEAKAMRGKDRPCNNCGQMIYLERVVLEDGAVKWLPKNLDGTLHSCR